MTVLKIYMGSGQSELEQLVTSPTKSKRLPYLGA